MGLLYIRFTDNFTPFYNTLFIITAICSVLLFSFGFTIFKKLSLVIGSHSNSASTIVFYQLYLHLIIIAFIVFDHVYSSNYTAMLVLSPFLIAFFATARITWRACFTVLGSKIYSIFTTGSTALLIWSIVLTLLGLFYQHRFLTENLHTLVLIYFAIHFAELGFVLLKIKKDLSAI
jgi:small-conductance mechanosensitive channel